MCVCVCARARVCQREREAERQTLIKTAREDGRRGGDKAETGEGGRSRERGNEVEGTSDRYDPGTETTCFS